MDLHNTEELEDLPVGPEEDYLVGLFALDASPAEPREANEIVELFLTLGADLHVARAKVAELHSPSRVSDSSAGETTVHPFPTWPGVRSAPGPQRTQAELPFGG